MNTTVRIKASQINKDWHVLDAEGVPLGRIATQAATLLRGKHKPTFEPHLDCGDFVIIVNAEKVTVSGAKVQEKLYYRHSGYPGGLRSRTFEQEHARFPDRAVRRAIWGMLPKGSLGESILNHLKVYAGPDHPHQSQVVGSERVRAERDDTIPWAPPQLRALRSASADDEDASLEVEEAAAETEGKEASAVAEEVVAEAASEEMTAGAEEATDAAEAEDTSAAAEEPADETETEDAPEEEQSGDEAKE